jgi:hypothetical protein
MIKECLVCSFMRLGVPFIAPRQLGAVESNLGGQFLPSIDWCTGHYPVQISFLFWCSRPLKIWSRWHTGHCPVPPSDCWPGHASCADCAADRWLTGQSGAPPDSPVNYSHTESHLEGGVNRVKLKFTKLITTTSRVSVRNIIKSERGCKNKSQANKEVIHKDLFYRGSVLTNLLPVEEATKAGSFSTLSLSQTVSRTE